MKVTVAMDNNIPISAPLPLTAEHGAAFLIEIDDRTVLYDTGQTGAVTGNIALLGKHPQTLDTVVISHGHYDHVGGLPAALEAAPGATLWLHPAATERKFSRAPDGRGRRISTDFMEAGAFGPARVVRRVMEPTEVVPGVWATGTIPRTNDFEDVGGPFFLDEDCTRPDPILDDMALFLPDADGVSVVFGCAHAGVVNTLDHIFRQTGNRPVRALVGGLHLLNASPTRMEQTVRHLRALAPQRMGFCHCTGARAVHRLWSEFPEAAHEVHVGTSLVLGES